MRAVVILIALLAAHRDADACKWEYVSMFRRFEQAGAVVRAKVRVPGGKFALAVLTPLKGAPPKLVKLGIGRNGTSCSPHLRGTGIAFLTADMQLMGTTESFTTEKEQVDAIITYAAAKTVAEKAAALVEIALTSESTYVRYAAEVALAGEPAFLAAITTADRERMIEAIENPKPSSFLPIVLARLGLAKDQLKGAAAELVAERKFEAVTKPEELAKIIEATPTGTSARAAAAFERCERLRGKWLADIRRVVDEGIEGYGLDWRALADACRN